LRLIADMTEYTMREAPGWYPLSISGYHIGEAGANPGQELAFTLANGLTYVETLRARGLPIEEFTRRFSFFFTSGSELEFNVLGRVARRVWAVALRRCYGVEGPGLALRFHSQTSGRSLQDSEPLHNLTRVALQAEHALHNNTNSLHTNSYKETYTTPQEDDVLLAMGSQQIPLVESGDFGYIENLNQGAYGLTYLEAEVERAVHRIFREIDQQGGVLPAIENEYFRTAIQEEVQRERGAMRDGKRRVVGVNYLTSRDGARPRGELVHIPMTAKRSQAARTRAFKREHAAEASAALERLQAAAVSDANVFEALLDAVEHATVGQVTHALWEVWGRFRPSM
ncbi:MAG: methylmalonyl-CoA mutase family protein, partial [Chloroflexi bacterium]|nr:methylmalonyl-CoA mutase family protein [Chloroflexota bacterium]